MWNPNSPVTPVQLDDFQTRFAKVLRRRRLLARLNQEELAETAVLKIAAALGMTLTELFQEIESDDEPDVEPPEIPKGRPPKEQKGRGGRAKGTRKK
jgi:hypothetical protein